MQSLSGVETRLFPRFCERKDSVFLRKRQKFLGISGQKLLSSVEFVRFCNVRTTILATIFAFDKNNNYLCTRYLPR